MYGAKKSKGGKGFRGMKKGKASKSLGGGQKTLFTDRVMTGKR